MKYIPNTHIEVTLRNPLNKKDRWTYQIMPLDIPLAHAWIDKLKLLKMQGVTAVDILFDPDDAGQDAALKLEEMCDSAEILHKNIKIPRSLGDAGALTVEKVKQLKEQLYG